MALAHIQLKNSPQLSVVFASEFYSETSWISVSYRSRPKIELERGLLFVSWRLNATRAALHATLSPRTSRLLSTGSSKFRFRFVFVAGHLLGSPVYRTAISSLSKSYFLYLPQDNRQIIFSAIPPHSKTAFSTVLVAASRDFPAKH